MLRLVRQHPEHDQLYQKDAVGSHRLSPDALEILLDTCMQNMPPGVPLMPHRPQGVSTVRCAVSGAAFLSPVSVLHRDCSMASPAQLLLLLLVRRQTPFCMA